jgi:hypothetical protein
VSQTHSSSAASPANNNRCHRLNKECQSSPAVRKRRVIKSTPATKTARLEEKLDGLVSLLQSASRSLPLGTGNIVPAAQMQLSPESLQSPYPGLGDERSNEPYKRMPNQGVAYPGADLGLHPPIPTLATPNVASTSTAHNSPMAYSPYLFESSLKEADESLKIFRTYKLKHFPFIVLPASITAQELRRERPFLWFCAMAASSKSSTQQIVLGKEIRLIVGRQLLLEGERTLDLLLGLLAYIAWYVSPAAFSYEVKVLMIPQGLSPSP